MTGPESPALAGQIELLESLAFVAVEHGSGFSVLDLADRIDLYAHYLRSRAGQEGSTPKAFEVFVLDAALLADTRREAERATWRGAP